MPFVIGSFIYSLLFGTNGALFDSYQFVIDSVFMHNRTCCVLMFYKRVSDGTVLLPYCSLVITFVDDADSRV